MKNRIKFILICLSIALLVVVSTFFCHSEGEVAIDQNTSSANKKRLSDIREPHDEQIRSAVTRRDFFSLSQLATEFSGSGSNLWNLSFLPEIPVTSARIMRAEAIRRLLETNNCQTVLSLIKSDLGNGADRISAIGDLFRNAKMTPEMFDQMIVQLEFDAEKDTAAAEYGFALGTAQVIDSESLRSLIAQSERGKFAALEALKVNPVALFREPLSAIEDRLGNSLVALNALFDSGAISDHERLDVLDEISKSIPFRLYDALLAANPTAEIPNSVIEEMSKKNPKRTLEIALVHGGSESVDIPIKNALFNFGLSDVERSLEWFQSHEAELSESQRDQGAQGLSLLAVRHSEFDTAWEWTREIKDAGQRRKAEGEVWSSEKKVVEKCLYFGPAAISRECR
jgi:hypothetical protein